MNCANCHINLDWALANQALFEVESRLEQRQTGTSAESSFKEMSTHHPINLGHIIFIIALILMIIFSAKTDWPSVLVALLIFGVWAWFTETQEREQQQGVDKIWSELARQTGLTYIPSKKSFLRIYIPPSIQGEYRGHYVSLALVYEGGGGEYDAPRVFTKISLLVRNRAHFSLEIKERWFLARRVGRHDVTSGNGEFDRRFRVRGTPQEFAHRAIRLTDLQSMLMLDESQNKIMKMAYVFSWASSSRPTIKLNESDLICLQHGVLTLVSAQTAMLNMLCELAELVEKMETELTSSDTRRN